MCYAACSIDWQVLCLQVIGVIRQKCLFKNRPRAIISKAEPTGGGTT